MDEVFSLVVGFFDIHNAWFITVFVVPFAVEPPNHPMDSTDKPQRFRLLVKYLICVWI